MYLKQLEIVIRVKDLKINIEDIIKKHKIIKKWVYILHDKYDTAPHYHIYLNFGYSGVDTKQVAEWFSIPEQWISMVKCRLSEFLLYLIDDIQYYPPEIVANFDPVSEFQQLKPSVLMTGQKRA